MLPDEAGIGEASSMTSSIISRISSGSIAFYSCWMIQYENRARGRQNIETSGASLPRNHMKPGSFRPPRTTPLSRSAPDSAIPIFETIVIFEKCLKRLETCSKYSYGYQFLPCKAIASYLVWIQSIVLFKFDLVTRPPSASLALNFVVQPGDFK